MDKLCEKEKRYKLMIRTALFHPIICDHEARCELVKLMSSENVPHDSFYIALSGVPDLLQLGSVVDSERLHRRLLKTVCIVRKIKRILPSNSLLSVVASTKIESHLAQKAKAYLILLP